MSVVPKWLRKRIQLRQEEGFVHFPANLPKKQRQQFAAAWALFYYNFDRWCVHEIEQRKQRIIEEMYRSENEREHQFFEASLKRTVFSTLSQHDQYVQNRRVHIQNHYFNGTAPSTLVEAKRLQLELNKIIQSI